jgi:aminoglycoside phosphotransferase (APT) family kinase protein
MYSGVGRQASSLTGAILCREMTGLIGTGRTADVFEHGEGEVLRRYRKPRDTEREVAAMEHARAHGFPVPAGRALNQTEIVMQRLYGPTMLDDLGRRPWRIDSHAETLARLHAQLHSIGGPDWLPAPLGEGESLLHLDLHPDNVILTRAGPYVIDWPNAARGPAAADTAHTWIVLSCSTPLSGIYRRTLANVGRRLLVRSFLGHFDRAVLSANLEAAAAYRLANRALPDAELRAIERMAANRS